VGDAVSFVGEIEGFVSDLYPYRWPITIGAVVILAAVIAFGYRRGWHNVIRRHKLVSVVAVAAVLAVSIPAGDYFLSPLWERSFLEEESPLAVAAGDTPQPDVTPGTPSPGDDGEDASGSGDTRTAEPTPVQPSEDDTAPPASTPRVIASGEFQGADDFHFGRGQALLIETAPDTYTLRFEDFSVRNGPDLFVYLSQDPKGYSDDALELGRLKATDGAFNYEIPAGTEVSQFRSAIVWCKPFSVLFAAAPLS
jgi:hypothetical protein